VSDLLSQELLANELRDIVAFLERYLSPLNVRAMLSRALRERNVSADRFQPSDLSKISPNLQRGLGLFLTGSERNKALKELGELCELSERGGARNTPRLAPSRVSIDSEEDISRARHEARRLCELTGTTSLMLQKVTTIVSELARNIVSYATSGEVEITVQTTPTRRISITASDNGPGIPNLPEILAGRYRSKTGLGRGLLGTKRLADDFDVVTGGMGTVVRVEVAL
jgi:serine/threonine-protein kinase RsbT